jgi:hypothetical protein
MPETERPQSLDYRKEVLAPLFRYVRSSESFYVLGAASMGKTRLLDFLKRPEVPKHYLGEKADKHWLIRVDLNRLPVKDENWAFYELLLSSILLNANNHENIENLSEEIAKLDAQIIEQRDQLLALRFFEWEVNRLCQVYDLRLCFLFDEFDDAYSELPREIFRQLRAVRDANKTRLSFGLFLRNLPEHLRPPADNESFYELLSRNWIGLGPYTRQDALDMIQLLETRRGYSLTDAQREKLYEASGGHPGIIQAILGILIDTPLSSQKFDTLGWREWLSWQPTVMEECRKIWEGLSEDEHDGLKAFARGGFDKIAPPVEKLLFAKGLLSREGGDAKFFSRLFEQYVKSLQ